MSVHSHLIPHKCVIRGHLWSFLRDLSPEKRYFYCIFIRSVCNKYIISVVTSNNFLFAERTF